MEINAETKAEIRMEIKKVVDLPFKESSIKALDLQDLMASHCN